MSANFSYHFDGQIAGVTYADGAVRRPAVEAGTLREPVPQTPGGLPVPYDGTELLNEPAVTGGNPVLSGDKVLFNDMLGNTLGVKGKNAYQPIKMTAFGESDNVDAFFTGKPLVGELGYAFLFRNYRPEQGKWQTADPLGYPDGWNNFAYVNNAVIKYIDFLGGIQGYAIDTQIIGYNPVDGSPMFSYSIVTREKSQWGNFDFSAHYYVGNGQSKTLQSIGLADDIWNIIERNVINRNGGLLDQLDQLAVSKIDKTQTSGTAEVTYSTRNTYNFQEASWPIRVATLQTFSIGSVSWVFDSENEIFNYNFTMSSSFYFTDIFSDPLNLETLGLPRMDMPFSSPYLISGEWDQTLTGAGSIPE